METEEADDIEMLRMMTRTAACVIHEYVDTAFNWERDKKHIQDAVNAATHLNAIMLAAKEVS